MKSIWRHIVAVALILALIVASLLILNKTSLYSHTHTKDTQGFAFLRPDFNADTWNPNETVEEEVQVTDFKPFNLRTLFTVVTALLLFVITVSLLTLGGHGFDRNAVVLLLSLGTLIFLASVGGFLVYGTKEIQGREVVISRVTAKQKFCRSIDFDLDNYLSGNLTEPERMCTEDFKTKTLDEIMGQ